jgi:hypothetical protein
MKKIPLLFITVLSFQISFSQSGVWTWISGDDWPGDPGVFGTQGVPSVNNRPPAAYEYVDWKDNSGNFWIYGGTYPYYSDLWKFNPQTLEWTWVKGNATQQEPAFYGIQGISGPLNTPGQRSYGALSWIDTTGNLWLFGGSQSGVHNDLWKYEISNNEWTWMKGDSSASGLAFHGVRGVPGPLNNPGPRNEVSTAWTDSINNLWLFGGYGYGDLGTWGHLNDVMKYNISTNEWTWMKGSNAANALPSWGVKNVPDTSNDPGGRCSYTHWTDADGGLWMMGGFTLDSISDFMNDLWRYDINTNDWTWKSGTNRLNDTGVYHSQCVIDSTSNPGSRGEHRSCAQDNCGRFWFYGGVNWVASSYAMNDLWIFNPATLKWTLLFGSFIPIQFADFGTLGVPSVSNRPPQRSGAVAWWGNDNRFYMFGGLVGASTSTWNDMWVFTPDSSCIASCSAVAQAQFTSPDSICLGACIDFTNLSLNSSNYQWMFQGAFPTTSVTSNPINICYNNPGTYDVTLIASNINGSDTLTLSNYITVYQQPSGQAITQNFDTLFAIAGSASYQWYFNGNIINGATDYFYIATASGDYNVIATDINGCEVEAVINNVIAGSSQLAVSSFQLAIFPNPVSETLTITSDLLSGTAMKILIYNMLGELALQPLRNSYRNSGIEGETNIDVTILPSGIYWIEINSGDKFFRVKFVKR